MSFEKNWEFIVNRSHAQGIPVVQDRSELEHVSSILSECKSYLEVGTAEGNSLYVLAKSMPEGSEITYIDWAEKHTKNARDFILDRLKEYDITEIHGNSNDFATQSMVKDKKFDAVLIDAGHESWNVVIDAIFYGQLATKYIIFHDIGLPEVEKAFNWYCRQRNLKNYRVINSETFGFGIIECMQ